MVTVVQLVEHPTVNRKTRVQTPLSPQTLEGGIPRDVLRRGAGALYVLLKTELMKTNLRDNKPPSNFKM